MKRSLFVCIVCLCPSIVLAECVVLLHGLARSDMSLIVIEEELKDAGFDTVNQGYPSRRMTINALQPYVDTAVAQCADAPIHFVTHSMGGVLVRAWLRDHDLPQLGRVVMMGPPNKGSALVDVLGDIPGFDYFNGPAGAQLSTEDGSFPNQLPPVTYPVGVIAGAQSLNPIYSSLIPGPDDGKVAVQETGVAGMTDHITLPVTHTFMMNNPMVVRQTLEFLINGAFDDGLSYTKVLADDLLDKGPRLTLPAE